VKAVNAAGRLLRAAGVPTARLEEGWLLLRAVRNTGLSDFGDEGFREPLQRVLQAYEEESRLTPVGRIIAQRDTLRTLENRLHLIEARKRHPEIADAPIRDPLLAVYPDARIVQTHRDPVKGAASLASLVCLLRGMGSDQVDPGEVGADWSRRLAQGLSRAMAERDWLEVGESRILDVHFRDFRADPLDIVRRIYATFGMELGGEAERRMTHFLERHPQNEHGRHEYTLQGAGLDLETERGRFEAYRRRFDIPSEIAA
jgi:hypothetical protein